jgi:hypothetical protein
MNFTETGTISKISALAGNQKSELPGDKKSASHNTEKYVQKFVKVMANAQTQYRKLMKPDYCGDKCLQN